MVKKVFDKFVAPDYSDDGFTTFMQFINPATIYSRNFRGNSLTLLCRAEDRIVGVLELQGWTHILLLFVDAEFHGVGIARELVNLAIASCRERAKAEFVTVNASPYGVPIYKKLGFVPTSSQKVQDGIRFTPMRLVLN